jgi:hypothetical protein
MKNPSSRWNPVCPEYVGVYAYSVQFNPTKGIFRVRVKDHFCPRNGSTYSYFRLLVHATEVFNKWIEYDHHPYYQPSLKNSIKSQEKRKEARKRAAKRRANGRKNNPPD